MIQKEIRNKLRFLQIICLTLLCEIFLWWICPISLIFGIIVLITAFYFYKNDLFEEKYPKVLYIYIGIVSSIIWALIYGALEFYIFQNPLHPLFLFTWFTTETPIGYIGYWSLLIFSHFFLLYFITRNLSISIVLTSFYCINEDLSFWIFYGITNGVSIMPPPTNWFQAFPNIFPQWFIDLGVQIQIWPYVPLIYVIIWSISIPLIILIIFIAKSYNKKNRIRS